MNTEVHGQDGFGPWRKSSFSGPDGNECVEVAFDTTAIGLRDSKNPDGPKLNFNHDRWLTFLTRATGTE
ncbi:MAG TPA: DUF397 domain-containing protein [Actinoallomurus sp.]